MLNKLKATAVEFFQRHSTVIIINAVKVLGFLLLFGLTCGIYKFLCLFLPTLISILIVVFLLHKLVLTICRIIAFPGSTWYWRRNIENYFQRVYVTKMKKRIVTLRALVEYILEERHWNHFCNAEELAHVRKTISSTLHIFQKQLSHHTLNNIQRDIMNQFTDIEQLLNDLKICTKPDNKSFTVWSFLEGRERYIEQPKTILYFGDKNQGYILLNKCAALEDRLTDIVTKKRLDKAIKRWMFEEAFGTLNQLREELEIRYKCRPMSLKTDKDVVLDGMLVFGKNTKEERHSMFESRNKGKVQECKRDQPADKTIIFCCPNAGYYEYMFCENEWVELYLRNGFNVLLWNYRGFGRSTGRPTPNGFRRDGEAIVDFLRQDLKMRKIGVHGESLGGIVTTHIGRTKNIDYLCADRTFASLSRVAEISFGSILAKLFRLLTLWDDQISRDYLKSPCYKIITSDPKDEIINLLSSLKYGVTSRIIQQKMGLKDVIPIPNLMEDRSSSVFRCLNLFKKFNLAVKREFKLQKLERELNNYNELLTKDQTLALFCAFNRISELFETLSSLNALNNRKKNHRPRENRPQMSKPTQPGKPGDQEGEDPRQRSLLKGATTVGDEGISFVNETKGLNESLDPKGANHSDDSDIIESIHKKSYYEEFNEEAQHSEKVVDLLVKIFGVFEDLEAGGVFLSDVLYQKESLRFLAFQHFIHCFKIWGSYYPLLGVMEKGATGRSFYYNNAVNKLKHFISKIEKILQKQRQEPRSSNKLISYVLEDLDVISSIMPNLYQRLVAKNTNPLYTAANTSRFNSSKQQEIELELGSNKDTQDLLRTSSGAYTDIESTAPEDYNIGHLLPLTCGHNGTPRPHEIQLFEYLFRNSGLVEEQ